MSDDDGAGSLEQLLNDGWAYHDRESERLASELEAAAEAALAPGQLPPFVHLSVHTIGEHLGDWPRALAVGKRAIDGRTPSPDAARAWGRLYVAAVLAGEPLEAANLELTCLDAAGEESGPAWLDMRFMLVDALVGSARIGEAAPLYLRALKMIDRLGSASAIDRTIASVSNNLAWELLETSLRSPDEDALMRRSAETSLEFWLKCGNWINAERGHYLNAIVANAVRDPESALAHADSALEIIAANGERPLDSALLHLARAAALAAIGDHVGRSTAVAEADRSAASLSDENLRTQFAAERAKLTDG